MYEANMFNDTINLTSFVMYSSYSISAPSSENYVSQNLVILQLTEGENPEKAVESVTQ